MINGEREQFTDVIDQSKPWAVARRLLYRIDVFFLKKNYILLFVIE